MPLGLGLASSHAPGMWAAPETWGRYYNRIHAAFAVLREQFQQYKPDALIMIGDDQGDMFDDACNPTFSVYTGEEPMWGLDIRDRMSGGATSFMRPPGEIKKAYFKNHVELSKVLLKGLIKRGFDMANIGKFEPRGAPERGVSHMLVNLAPEVDPSGEVPRS